MSTFVRLTGDWSALGSCWDQPVKDVLQKFQNVKNWIPNLVIKDTCSLFQFIQINKFSGIFSRFIHKPTENHDFNRIRTQVDDAVIEGQVLVQVTRRAMKELLFRTGIPSPFIPLFFPFFFFSSYISHNEGPIMWHYFLSFLSSSFIPWMINKLMEIIVGIRTNSIEPWWETTKWETSRCTNILLSTTLWTWLSRLNEMIIFSHQFFPPFFFNGNDVNWIQVLIMKWSSFSLLADLEVELKSSPVTHPAITNSN